MAVGAVVIVSIVLVLVVRLGAQSRDDVIESAEKKQRGADLSLPPNILSISNNDSYCINNNYAQLLFYWKPMSDGTHIVSFLDNRGNILEIKREGEEDSGYSENLIIEEDDLSPKIIIKMDDTQSCGSTFNLKIKTQRDASSIESSLRVNFVNRSSTIILPDPEDPDPEDPEIPYFLYPIDGNIWYLEHLAYIDTNSETLSGNYTLMRDLDFNDTNSYFSGEINTDWTEGDGWDPIGIYESNPFTGSLDGNGFTISNLYINRPTENNQGLFGFASNASFENITFDNVNIYGQNYVGGLVGMFGQGIVFKTSVISGSITGSSYVGGLVGAAWALDFFNNFSTVSVNGNDDYVGGLIGSINFSDISSSYFDGVVISSTGNAGGLIGYIDFSDISNSYSLGSVSSTSFVGGLVGYSFFTHISNSYSNSSIQGTVEVGGLVGFFEDGSISNSYSTGSVFGNNTLGGLVGNFMSNTITNSFWYDHANNPDNCYFDGNVGCTSIDNEEYFYNISNYPMDLWDFDNIWSDENNGVAYPVLIGN